MNDATKSAETAKRATIEATATIGETMRNVSIPEGQLKLEFLNGRTITVDTASLTPEMQIHAMLHGLKQKLVDAGAISRNPENGRAASVEDKFAAVKEVADRLTGANGEEPAWNKRREGGGGSGGLLFRALCRLYTAKTPEQIKEFLDGKTDKDKAALRKNPKVSKIIDDIRTEEGGDGMGEDLLAELGD